MYRTRSFRYENEQVVLALTLLLVLAVIILTSTATFCLSGVFILGMFLVSAMMIRTHHQALMRHAIHVDRGRTPELTNWVIECGRKLQPGPVDVFLINQKQVNAYTFGIRDPKVLVLYTPLLQAMNGDELKFIIGHEMGHVVLGHTWLNTIIGGMAGIPAPFGASVLLYTAFRWWNRMCEFSADRAGLLACGDINIAISALVKLAAPQIRTQGDFERALALIDTEDDQASNRLAEVFQTHPMLIRRINELRKFARTAEYQRIQIGMNGNLGNQPAAPVLNFQVPEQVELETTAPPAVERSAEERWPWMKPTEIPSRRSTNN
jgi:Zn-dependent protease with chaperone function